MTEVEKLKAGIEYDFGNIGIMKINEKANNLVFEYNHTNPNNHDRLYKILKELLGEYQDWINIVPPVYMRIWVQYPPWSRILRK